MGQRVTRRATAAGLTPGLASMSRSRLYSRPTTVFLRRRRITFLRYPAWCHRLTCGRSRCRCRRPLSSITTGSPRFGCTAKIFATLPDGRHAHVMLDEGGIRAAVSEQPRACSELWWGKRLAAVRVDLDVIEDAMLTELVTDAWRRKAPRRLV